MDEHLAKIKAMMAESRSKIVEREARGVAPLDRLRDEEVKLFRRDGFVFVPGELVWTLEEYDDMIAEVDEMETWPDAPGKYMKYYEDNLTPGHTGERILCRIENFLQFNKKLANIVDGDKMRGMVSQLFGEECVLWKEKINFKKSGADGFKPHQDHAAGWWLFGQSLHISSLVCIDPATEANGALALVRGAHRDGLLCDEWKEIPKETCDKLEWELVPTKPGDIVFFDSFVPHKSGPNPSPTCRRVLYNTYAKKSEGDYRDQYYAEKRKNLPPDCERDPTKTYEYKI